MDTQLVYLYNFSIELGSFKAWSFEEAQAKALKKLQALAESNDGSEFLANAEPQYRGTRHYYETPPE